MNAMNPCKICAAETKNNCSNCKQIYYGSTEHQKQDWKSHKRNCLPFKMVINSQLGRHLVTTRNIKLFEVVMKETPSLRGPSQATPPVCCGCLNIIEPSNYTNCELCGWLLCGRECKQKSEHKYECELTVQRGRKVNVQEFTNPRPMYQCITTVRGSANT
uniref:MYND-type domain-containing protein n=1 Tax=Glossina brevipalpis TaxID=37001 RepID=A0A1A9W9S4_9MUSC